MTPSRRIRADFTRHQAFPKGNIPHLSFFQIFLSPFHAVNETDKDMKPVK